MFLLSKVLWLAAQPLSLVFIALATGWMAAAAGFRRLGLFLSGLAAVFLFTTLFTTAGALALQRLEDRFPAPVAPSAPLSCIIILGGAFENAVMASRGGIEFNQAADRFIEGVRLAQLHPGARILISGGDGSLSGVYDGDAVVAESFFARFGIGKDRLLQDTTSRTTFENAQNTAELLTGEGLADCALVTSAFHMPRSVGLFRKAGISVKPWPTDYRTSGKVTLGFDFTQPSLNTQYATTAMREWLGLAVYFASGRTHTLFPG